MGYFLLNSYQEPHDFGLRVAKDDVSQLGNTNSQFSSPSMIAHNPYREADAGKSEGDGTPNKYNYGPIARQFEESRNAQMIVLVPMNISHRKQKND